MYVVHVYSIDIIYTSTTSERGEDAGIAALGGLHGVAIEWTAVRLRLVHDTVSQSVGRSVSHKRQGQIYETSKA